MKISIVVPAHNEEGNIIPLRRKIKSAMKGVDYNLIFVDDGSKDWTLSEMEEAADDRTTVIGFPERRGKCFALFSGIKHSSGDIIATMDADLQNDPNDIIRMVEELDSGYDCICGWRARRMDDPVKRASSRIGNSINNIVLGVGLHDNTCPVKVFRRECVSNLTYFREFHRFIPVMVKYQGFTIREMKICHRRRSRGKSKYGIRNRLLGNVRTMWKVRFKPERLMS